MTRISAEQWTALENARQDRLRQRLVSFVEGKFGRPAPGGNLRSPEEVTDAALQFADTVGAMTEAQIARIAVLLVAVNRRQSPPDEVARVREALTHPDRTPDQRIDDAAALLGIET